MYHEIDFTNTENDFIAFENVFAGTRKSNKKNNTFAGVALYKLRNLHKLFFISPAFILNDGQQSRPNASENAHQVNFFDLGQAITSDIALKKRNFLLKNLYNILKNKSTLSKKIMSAHRTVNAPSLKLTLKKINSISLKGLRILKKARKNKNFLLKTLK